MLWSDGGGVAFLLKVLLTWGKGGYYESGLLHMTLAYFLWHSWFCLFAGDSDGGSARIWKDSVGTEILKRKP